CANNANVNLFGSVTAGATTGAWSSSGSGTFSPDSLTLNATYIPSASDTTIGNIVLTLISTNYGNCNPVSDSMVVTITSQPIVNAGNNLFVCNDNNVNLNGAITNGNGTGVWTTNGNGTFSPNDSSLTVTYIPGSNDTIIGTIVITLTSTNNGNCLPVSDSLIVNFTPRPLVNAGSDLTICSNDSALLAGTVSGSSTTGYWITLGNGYFYPDSSNLNAYYIPDSADIANGSVYLILTSANACPVSDSVLVIFQQVPVVNAGPNQVICLSQNQVILNGSISGSTNTGIWSTLGTGTFMPDSVTLNATYQISSDDSIAGTVNLILTSTNNGVCSPQSDAMQILITPVPSVNAGADTVAC
ncbi:MAG: hypothetical protein COZ59_07110, partial [Bacteroidetes bacterium CG_4_8_14_3_um_filter_31_14]